MFPKFDNLNVHILIILLFRFVTHGGNHPDLALTSVKVLYSTVCSSNVQPELVGLFTSNEVISVEFHFFLSQRSVLFNSRATRNV